MQSCQKPKSALDRFSVKSLSKLTELESPPPQPVIEFTSPQGETMQLSEYSGKVVLVNAWATWCPPCVAEMPSLNALQKARGGDDFQVVTISLDNKKSQITEFFEKNGIDALPQWHDGTYEINGKLRLPGLPTTVLYNRQGREVARLSGEAEWDSTEALSLIDYLIAQ
ncbi:thiol-disulfide isomerase/thioredoxin [Litorimonas taeanensis]|uniref:Thiol-disulfide isomerase/thioredoxin n=1 Tax=Litorimonas taeanensis TaxID=568099 RepID=A0A420WCW8_9PROT|nr:thiol-disulfide isomerase/thioredoxin [Litorimonas taeanensis]